MKKETILIGQATKEQIQEWKNKYADGIYALVVDGHIGYFKNPNRNDMNCAMTKASPTAPLDMYEEMAHLTCIGGSEAILKENQMFYGAVQQLKTKMDGKNAVMVNL